MICNDHTTHERPSELFWLINEPQLPSDPKQAKRHTYQMRIAGTSLAMCVIRNLLRHHDAYRRKKATLTPSDAEAWPLSPTQLQGLRAALYFLRIHSDQLLKAERDE
ncbi:hypothetical protein [Dyella choica]|uniref:Uncharacterized protein n=1 Tax=Dyella choica TaxID=1927959 RepID=A0A3S0R5X1_9GAMM|nr:hypothetical protein [Dyella choica]RUL78951.1 hypothetical protein EKH80_03895 [Dyella choica]